MRHALWAAAFAAATTSVMAGSDYIERIERKLEALGYTVGAVDGSFDEYLQQAIRNFQYHHRLTVDGRLTRETHDAILRALPAPAVTAAQAPAAQPAATPPSPAPAPAPQAQPAPAAAAAPPAAAPVAPMAKPSRNSWPGTPKRRFGFLLEAAFEFGGDPVATVVFTDNTAQDVNAGQGVTLGGGVYFRPAPIFDARATVGYKYVTTAADNADIHLDRLVTELSGRFWLPKGFWAGLGAVYHSNIALDVDGLGRGLDFDNALGGQLELGWRWIALSYTALEYTDEMRNEYDASNGGLTLNWSF